MQRGWERTAPSLPRVQLQGVTGAFLHFNRADTARDWHGWGRWYRIKNLRTWARSLPQLPLGTESLFSLSSSLEVGEQTDQVQARVGRKQGHPPNDLVALVAHRSLAVVAAPSWASSSSSLHNGGAVLQRGGCGWLAVPGQHGACFVRGIALGKRRVHSPGWAAAGAGGGRACQGQGKWLQGGAQGSQRTEGGAWGSSEEPTTTTSLEASPLPKAQAHSLTRPGFLGCS